VYTLHTLYRVKLPWLSLPLPLPVLLYLSLCFLPSVFHSISPLQFLPLCFPLCLSPSLLSLSLWIFPVLCHPLCFSFSVSSPLSLYVSLSVSLFVYSPRFLSLCVLSSVSLSGCSLLCVLSPVSPPPPPGLIPSASIFSLPSFCLFHSLFSYDFLFLLFLLFNTLYLSLSVSFPFWLTLSTPSFFL
jgi:hypothetical protein